MMQYSKSIRLFFVILTIASLLYQPHLMAQTSKAIELIDSLLQKSSDMLDIQIDSSEVLAHKSIKMAEDIKALHKKMEALERLSQIALRRGDYEQCKNYLDQILLYCEKHECDNHLLAMTHNVFGAYYYRTGNALFAGESFIKAADYFKQSSRPERYMSPLFNAATVLMSTGGKDKAFELFNRIASDPDADPFFVTKAYTNMGMIKVSESLDEEARTLFLKAINEAENNNLKSDEGYFNLALSYEESRQYQEALKIYTKLKDELSSAGEQRMLQKVYAGLANVYAGLNNPQKALEYFNLAEANIDATTQKVELLDLLEMKHHFYANLGKHKEAYETLQAFYTLRNEIEIKANKDRFMELQTQYETAQKEAEIEQVKLENTIKEKVIATQRIGLIAICIILILLAVLLRYIHRAGKIKDKLNKALVQKNDQINLLHRELRHRVNNNLAFITSLMQMQGRRIKNQEAAELLFESESRVRAMSLLHRKLHLEVDNSTEINLKNYLEEIIFNLQKTYPFDGDAPELHLEIDDTKMDAENAMRLGLIINELVTNAFKHAFPNETSGQITIKVHRDLKERLRIFYSDNGVGLPTDPVINQSAHMGMLLIQSLSKLLQAEANFKSEKGTSFEMTIAA